MQSYCPSPAEALRLTLSFGSVIAVKVQLNTEAEHACALHQLFAAVYIVAHQINEHARSHKAGSLAPLQANVFVVAVKVDQQSRAHRARALRIAQCGLVSVVSPKLD